MSGAIAWLGMYDHPAQQAANDRFWEAIAETLRVHGVPDVPLHLSRHLSPAEAWSHPGLLFGHICTRPLREHHPTLQPLGYPIYIDTGSPGRHHARLIVRDNSAIGSIDSARGARVAVNDWGSNTGVSLLEAMMGPIANWASSALETGSHRASLDALSRGTADIAAIDEVTFAVVAEHEPAAVEGLRSIGATPDAPTPPFVTAAGTSHHTVRTLSAALDFVIADPAFATTIRRLRLNGIVPATSPQPTTRIDARRERSRA